ncbi:hypothetical protein DRQ12_12390, partial [candidate division KSB1 bacterium]
CIFNAALLSNHPCCQGQGLSTQRAESPGEGLSGQGGFLFLGELEEKQDHTLYGGDRKTLSGGSIGDKSDNPFLMGFKKSGGSTQI